MNIIHHLYSSYKILSTNKFTDTNRFTIFFLQWVEVFCQLYAYINVDSCERDVSGKISKQIVKMFMSLYM